MKKLAVVGCIFAFLNHTSILAQEELQLTSKDSIVQSSWMVGLGYNFVDDSGDAFQKLFAVKTQWNGVPYPSRLSIGKYFKSGIGVEAIASYNKYNKGKLIEGAINLEDSDYYALDTRLSYDLNKIIGQTGWFDPYVGVGIGYSNADKEERSTYNGVIGFRTWFSERWSLDLSSTGKWRTGSTGSNHIQHAASVIYQFGIEKGLSKKGQEKLDLILAQEKERQRINDSIAAVDLAKEAEALAKSIAAEKERDSLLALEANKIDLEKQRKLGIEKSINDLGLVYFALNSSYLNANSKKILNNLVAILNENPTVELKVTSHTDSRGQSIYNKWLSQRRVDRTVAYLIDNGIAPSRVVAEAYGEEQLLNECDDNIYCPEEKHQINRRSEFVITKY